MEMRTIDKIKRKALGSQKGVLLTLLVVILFVLMLGEVLAFVVVGINYNVLLQSASTASYQGSISLQVQGDISSMLHTYLVRAVSGLASYEGNPAARNTLLVNNTSLFLSQLMSNGIVYGRNLSSYVGTTLVNNFANTINNQLKLQGANIKFQNTALSVFQGTPSTINATFTALGIINSSAGSIVVPISASTSLPLNGTADIAAIQSQQTSVINIQSSYPKAIQVGGVNAVIGTNSPFMFVYGTVVKEGGQPTCSSIPTALQNGNYILVTPDASQLASQSGCGMGGIVTNVMSATTPNVPWLVYQNFGSIYNSIYNGTQLLLSGPALSLYNITPLQSAIQNNYYYVSPYTPSYFDTAQNSLVQKQSGGIFSYGLLNRQTPYFSDAGGWTNSNILVPAASAAQLPPTFAISFWINKNAQMGNCDSVISQGSATLIIYARAAGGCSAGSAQNTSLTFKYKDSSGSTTDNLNSINIPALVWVHAVAVFAQGTLTWYINGNLANQYTGLTAPPTNTNALLIGGGDRSFNGSITNVQIYNAPLSASDVAAIYAQGLAGKPLRTANVMAWYPLNGNAIDYIGYSHNGIANSVSWKTLSGYISDPQYGGYPTPQNVSPIEGALGCQNRDQCTNRTAPQLYLSNLPLSLSGNSAVNESATLGLPKSLVPRALSFAGNAFVQMKNSLAWIDSATQSFTISLWIYPTSTSPNIAANGVVLNEINVSSGSWQDSIINIANGIVWFGYEGPASAHQCTSLGAAPLNRWTFVAVKFDGGTNVGTGYLNGVKVGSTISSARTVAAASMYYNLGQASTTACGGTGAGYYNGLIADFRMINRPLDAANVLNLYLNDSALGKGSNVIMPLTGPYQGMQNTTSETQNGPVQYGTFNSLSGVTCSVANVVLGTCGLSFTPG